MIKAIFYKEWIKTRWVFILSAIILGGFSIFSIMNIFRMIELKGAVHIWEVMIQRDALFVNILTYLPLIIGIVFAISQYVPEMHQKCLKLTLHLPFDSKKMIAAMIGYGVLTLTLLFGSILLTITLTLTTVLAAELVRHIILSALVWFIAGIASYIFTAWSILEPTWKRRIFNIIISVLLLKIFFIESMGEAYNAFLPTLSIATILYSSFIFLSVHRFKDGEQD